MAEQCPNLALCADIAANPAPACGAHRCSGWQLLFLQDGEAEPISLLRFEDVLTFWREFARKYLTGTPAFPMAA